VKYSELKAIEAILKQKRKLTRCARVRENGLLLRFDDERWIADFSAADPIFAPVDLKRFDRTFNAPFDQAISRFANASAIVKCDLDGGDKIFRFDLLKTDGWKEARTTLVLEFIPRRLNALLLDENGIILESLRRTTKLRVAYEAPPLPPFAPKCEPIGDVRAAMKSRYEAIETKELERRKNLAIASSREKAAKINETLRALSSPEALENAAAQSSEEGGLILANLNKIAPYSQSCAIEDYDGKRRTIALDALRTPQSEAERKYDRAKRLRAKAKGIFRERQNLEERAAFYDRLVLAIASAQTISDLEAIVPTKRKKGDKKSPSEPIEEFIIGGFRALLGRNEKGNALLLKRAKARDVWFHLQGRPSAHLIVQTAKAELPQEAIEKAAKICARFSLSEKGDYYVDYTKRQFVKVEYGAHVTYARQKSVVARLE
jgi:predicted ribosome quality control (RQC) complex YloA/Tae2 family protein